MENIIKLFILLIITTGCLPDIVLALDEPLDMPWYLYIARAALDHFPEINAWFAASMIALMGFLRAASELLLFIAKKTETKEDDKFAAKLASVVRWLGKIIGWFGLGSPKK